ncbi:MAG: hypothetical protein CSA29_01700 [Desulfobacterales bacterium]|nr:MAG: hypothetical protein CSA29_01700 [Desulfobacterales bacterium]
METFEAVLQTSDVFKGVDAEGKNRLEGLFQKWEFNTGDTLACAGDPAQFFFLLEKGTLMIGLESDNGVVLDQPGDYAAMEILSRKGIYIGTVTALERGVAWSIPREDFLALIQDDIPSSAAVMAAWQTFIDDRAPFAKQIADVDIPSMY